MNSYEITFEVEVSSTFFVSQSVEAETEEEALEIAQSQAESGEWHYDTETQSDIEEVRHMDTELVTNEEA